MNLHYVTIFTTLRFLFSLLSPFFSLLSSLSFLLSSLYTSSERKFFKRRHFSSSKIHSFLLYLTYFIFVLVFDESSLRYDFHYVTISSFFSLLSSFYTSSERKFFKRRHFSSSKIHSFPLSSLFSPKKLFHLKHRLNRNTRSQRQRASSPSISGVFSLLTQYFHH